MTATTRLLRGTGIILLGVVAALAAAVVATGPSQPVSLGQARSDPDNRGPQNAGKLESRDSSRLNEYKKGDSYTKDAKLLERAAKWYVFRLTDPKYQEYDTQKQKQYGMVDLIEELLRQLPNHPNPRVNNKKLNENQAAYARDFSEQLVKCLRRVLNNDRPIAQINGARCLARLADWGYEEIADVLADILKDEAQSDAVKFYACQGLKNLFSIDDADDAKRSVFKDAGREAKAILALLAFVQRKSPLPENAKPEEVEALRYVRREAIRALGQTRHPAVINAKTKQIEGQTAWWLLKIVRKDGLSPSPSFSEQVEAAVAVCQLRPELLDRYHMDYAAYHIGQFMKEFSSYYKDHEKDPIPWRLYGNKLTQAFNDMKALAGAATSSRQAEASYAANVAGQATKLVAPLLSKKENTVLESTVVNDLSTWLQKNAPKSASLYEGVPESVIKSAEAAGTSGE